MCNYTCQSPNSLTSDKVERGLHFSASTSSSGRGLATGDEDFVIVSLHHSISGIFPARNRERAKEISTQATAGSENAGNRRPCFPPNISKPTEQRKNYAVPRDHKKSTSPSLHVDALLFCCIEIQCSLVLWQHRLRAWLH